MGLKLLSGFTNSGNWFPIKVWGCVLAITTGGLFCSRGFGTGIVFYILGFTISEMWDKLIICGSEDVIVCIGGGVCVGLSCVE